MTNGYRAAIYLSGLLGLGLAAFLVTRAVIAQPHAEVEVRLTSDQLSAETAMKPQESSPVTRPAANQRQAEHRQQRPSFVVCLDPGHPSEVNDGMHKVNGLSEAEVNWDVSLRIKAILENVGVRVVMTKSKLEQRVTNKQRAEIANSAKADLMVRIHADAGGGTGFTIYYPRRQGTKDGLTGPPQSIIQVSAKAAQHMHAAMADSLKGKLRDNGIRGDEQSHIGRQQGAFTGSIFSQVPVLLIEMCFLDNQSDANWIRVEANKNLMAHAIAKGTLAYLKNK